jgi:single-strand DNA-binding protein
MTEANVSFTGDLTDQPEVRYTESGIAPSGVPGGRLQSPGAGAVVLHRDRVARPSRACGRVPSQGQPSRGRGRLQQRSWTAEDGSARSVVEVVAEELGPSLRWVIATATRGA